MVSDGYEPIDGGEVPSADPALARIETYWTQVKAGRLVPARAEIDPRGMEGVLAHAFILERVSAGLARIRIAGSHLTDLLGLETRGLPLSAIFDAESRPGLAEGIEALFDAPAAVRLSVTSDAGFGRPELTGCMVLLPLRSDLGDITRVLGAVSLRGSVGRTPRRLTIRGQARKSLVGYAAPPGVSTGLSGRFLEPVPGASNPVEGPAKAGARVRSDHLRLVVVNDV